MGTISKAREHWLQSKLPRFFTTSTCGRRLGNRLHSREHLSDLEHLQPARGELCLSIHLRRWSHVCLRRHQRHHVRKPDHISRDGLHATQRRPGRLLGSRWQRAPVRLVRAQNLVAPHVIKIRTFSPWLSSAHSPLFSRGQVELSPALRKQGGTRKTGGQPPEGRKPGTAKCSKVPGPPITP
jgi:hypothetical protein